MQIETARRLLEIDLIYDIGEVDIPHDILKRQYKRQALIYHPDKNTSLDASHRFREIKEAFDLLEGYYGYGDCVDFDMEDLYDSTSEIDRTFGSSHDGYIKILVSFISSVVGTERMTSENSMVFCMVMEKISSCCETQVVIILRKIDLKLLKKIHGCLMHIRNVIHIPGTIIDTIDAIILQKEMDNSKSDFSEHLALYPTLNDLFDCNVYVTHRNKNKIMIPLWCSELVYDSLSGGEITVTCVPIVPSNIFVDENNDIIVNVKYLISDIWEKSILNIEVGKKIITLTVSELKLQLNQTVVFEKVGIPRFNENSIYDVSVISSIVVIVTLTI